MDDNKKNETPAPSTAPQALPSYPPQQPQYMQPPQFQGPPPGYAWPQPPAFQGPPPGFQGYGPGMVMGAPQMPQAQPQQPQGYAYPPGYGYPQQAPVQAPQGQPTAVAPSQPVTLAPEPTVETTLPTQAEGSVDILSTDGEVEAPKAPLGGLGGINLEAALSMIDMDLDHPAVFGADITVSWEGTMEVEKVRQAFEAHGLDPRYWPKAPPPATALRRALHDVYRGDMYKIDPIGGKGGKGVRAGGKGWGVSVKDTEKLAAYLAAGDDASLRDAAKHPYTLYVTAAPHKEGDVTTLMISPPDHKDADIIRQAFAKHQQLMQFSEDMSVVFTNVILPAAHAGGRGQDSTWFVQKGKGLELLKQVRSALLSVSTLDADGTLVRGGKVRLVAKILTRSAVESIMDAMIADADRMLSKVDDQIDNLGDKGLGNRILEIEKLRKTLQSHGQTLGTSTECISDRLTKMEGKLAAARARIWDEERKRVQGSL